jgi:hypothetical protein
MTGTQSVHVGQSTVYPVGDVNHDGLADWILKTRPDTSINGKTPYELRLYQGRHGRLPSLDSGQRIGLSEVASNAYFIAAGDWDGDTYTDLATEIAIAGDTSGGNTHGYEVSRVVIWWGNSKGQYTLADTSHLSSGTTVWGGVRAGIGDYRTPDGVHNLVFWTWGQGLTNGQIITTPKVMLFRGHRGGRWGRNGIPRTADWGWWTPPTFNRFTAIDQNCDGALDLAFFNDDSQIGKSGSLSILYGSTAGGMPDTSNLRSLSLQPVAGHAAILSDVSGDGVPELLVSSNEVLRIFAGEPGVTIDQQFGTGDDPPDPEQGRWYRRPWALLLLPAAMHDGWANAGHDPAYDLGDGSLDGINDIWMRSWPFLIEYNTSLLGEADGVWFCVLDSLIDGMYRAPEEEIRGTVRVGDIDGSGVSSIAVMFPSGVSFIKPTTALPQTGVMRQAINPPGVRCQGVASVNDEHPDDQHNHIQLTAMPNPATGDVRFQWHQPQTASDVRLVVYDTAGREVATLIPAAGAHSLTWDATEFATGHYRVTLISGSFTTTTPVFLVH